MEAALEDASLIWDDFPLLFTKKNPTVEQVEKRKKQQITTEGSWMTTPAKDISQFTTKATLGKPPYHLAARKILFHNAKYIVGLGASDDPVKHRAEHAAAVEEQEPMPQLKWPQRPTKEVLLDWSRNGLGEKLSTYTGRTVHKTPLLFHTFDTVFEEDDVDTPLAPSVESHPQTKSILEHVEKQTKEVQVPLTKRGHLFVGEFDSPHSASIKWNEELKEKLPFHIQCTGIQDPGYEWVMIGVYNRLLFVWDLRKPDLGPLVEVDLTTEFCTSKAIIDIVATTTFVAILDGRKRLTIVPIHAIVLCDAAPESVKEFREYLKENQFELVEESLLGIFHVPTAFSLGINQASPDTLYLGTNHGYIHELFVNEFITTEDKALTELYLHKYPHPNFDIVTDAEQKTMVIYHSKTYYTGLITPVQFISGRCGRIVCGSTQHVVLFTTPEDNVLRIETGSGYLTQVRNVAFQGNMIVIETNNRHLIVHNTVMNKQRTIPSTLGARLQDPIEEERQSHIRQSTSSLLHWNKDNLSIRMAYGTLTAEVWKL